MQDRYLDTWRAFERLLADGRVRAIGVSNFQPAHLERLRQRSGIVPAINQMELHPLLQQRELRAYHAAHGIATEAWSPLVRGQLLADPTIAGIAARHDRPRPRSCWHGTSRMGNVDHPALGEADAHPGELGHHGPPAERGRDGCHRCHGPGRAIGPDPDTFG